MVEDPRKAPLSLDLEARMEEAAASPERRRFGRKKVPNLGEALRKYTERMKKRTRIATSVSRWSRWRKQEDIKRIRQKHGAFCTPTVQPTSCNNWTCLECCKPLHCEGKKANAEHEIFMKYNCKCR